VLGKALGLHDDADARLDAAVRHRLGLGRRRRLLACLRPVLGLSAAARQERASDNSDSWLPLSAMQ
jgi:hypothetical protein